MNLDFLHEISKVAELTYECDRNLSSVSTFKIGGAASVILYPENEAALIDALEICIKRNIRYQIIGNASNILFSDSGFDGAVISTVKMQPKRNCCGMRSIVNIIGISRPAGVFNRTGICLRNSGDMRRCRIYERGGIRRRDVTVYCKNRVRRRQRKYLYT